MGYEEVEHAVEVILTLTFPVPFPSLHPHLRLDGIPGGGACCGGNSHPHPPSTLTLPAPSPSQHPHPPCTLSLPATSTSLHPHLRLDGIPGGGACRGGNSHPHPPSTLTLPAPSCSLHPHLPSTLNLPASSPRAGWDTRRWSVPWR